MELSKHMVDMITNSIEAMARHILVNMSFFGDWIILEVSDDGKGTTTEEVEAAMRGEKAPRGRGLALLKDAAEQSGGDIFVWSEEGHGTGVRATFGKDVPLGKVGDALIVFWQEMPITVITLSAVTENGAFVFDSRLIGERYGDPSEMDTMVKVRKEVNHTLTNLFGGK